MSNISIEYKYRTSQEIFESITLFWNFWIIEIILWVVVIALLFSLILYIWPILQILGISRREDMEKRKKKLSLQQILVTKEIETEIENEIKEEQEAKLKAKLN